jgi:diacylglycerol kinase (ATP)
MRAAAILGPGNTAKAVATFKRLTGVEWTSPVEQADAAVVFGGDGTIHRHLPALIAAGIPLLVVPCGSGNDLARALGLRSVRDSAAAWRTFLQGQSNLQAIDLGTITGANTPQGLEPSDQSISTAEAVPSAVHVPGVDQRLDTTNRHFCCVAGVGIDTEIARHANKLPRWLRGGGGYALSAPREFIRFAPLPMKISSNGAPGTFQSTLLAAVANAPAYGGGMKIAPQAKLDDGKLDVCVVRGMSVFKLFCLFPTVYFGRHLQFNEVEYEQTTHLQVETQHPLDVYADGEYVCQTPVEFGVAPQALKVLVPPGPTSLEQARPLTPQRC